MKTIEEFKQEYIDKLETSGVLTKMDIIEQNLNAIDSAVEFAQRWIPVEEELPPCSYEDILLKGIDYIGTDGIVDVGYMHDSADGKPKVENLISLSGELMKITHWRPIDLK